MKLYNITEDHSGIFAEIEARTGAAALRKAAREFPRRLSDYGAPGDVTWRAIPVDDTDDGITTAAVPVPSRGAGRVRIGEVAS